MKGRKKDQRGWVVQKGNYHFGVYRNREGKQEWVGEEPGHGFATYAQARRRLTEVLAEVQQGSYVKPKAGTFAVFAQAWLDGRLSIEGGTNSAYASIIRCHLIPALGDLEVSAIDFERAQNLVNDLSRKKNPRTGKRLQSKTIDNIVTLLNVMMGGKFGASAIKTGHTRHNPVASVERPKRSIKEATPPTPGEVARLAEAARELGGISHSVLLVGVSTGVRRQELLAVNYGDIDWRSKELRIRRAVKKAKADDGVHKWKWIIHTTKSEKSRRRIALTPTALKLFAGLKEVSGASDADLIFPKSLVGLTPADAFIDPDYFDTYVFGPVARKAGLGGMRFHDLRHFFASMLIAQNESAQYVRDQMGHHSVQVTFDLYGHLFPQARPEAAAKLDRSLSAVFSGASSAILLEGLLETDIHVRSKGSKPERAN